MGLTSGAEGLVGKAGGWLGHRITGQYLLRVLQAEASTGRSQSAGHSVTSAAGHRPEINVDDGPSRRDDCVFVPAGPPIARFEARDRVAVIDHIVLGEQILGNRIHPSGQATGVENRLRGSLTMDLA